MSRKTLAAVTVGLGLLWSLPIALAQQNGRTSEPSPTLLDKVENFGRNLFGGLIPRDDDPPPTKHVHQHQRQQQPAASADAQPASTATEESESAPRRPVQVYRAQPAQPQQRSGGLFGDLRGRSNPPSAGGTSTASRPAATRPAATRPAVENTPEEVPLSAASATPAGQAPAQAARSNETAAPETTVAAPSKDYGSLPLHQRMALLRKSPFEESSSPPAADPTATSGSTSRIAQPSSIGAPRTPSKPAAVASEIPSSSPTVVTPRQETRPATLPTPATTMAAPPVSTRPIPTASVPVTSVPVTSVPASKEPTVILPAAAPSGSAGLSNPPPTKSSGNVLVSRQSPNLSVETLGPRKIAVGKEAAYEVLMANSGGVAAEDVTVQIDLPAWADVRGSETSVGSVQMSNVPQGGRQLQWKMARLEANGRERLSVRLVPRESRPLDLGVKWDFRQSSSQAVIEVQEPKLTASLEGPREVLFGKKEQYRLRVGNLGTGDAENVVLKLWPVGSQAPAASHNFGTLVPGQQKILELELTARQVGNLTMKVELQCEGGGRAELAEPVLVRRAALELTTEGPKFLYVATSGVYRVRLTNPGTALARSVTVTATLPEELKLVAGSEGAQVEPGESVVRWKLDSLAPGADKTFDVKCTMVRAGTARVALAATAEDEISAAAAATTQVEAMADVAMEISDPSGPVPVGEDALYEIRLRNRGSKAAENVEVAVFFSQGIEPVTVEGGLHRISPGQVNFASIPTLPPGKEIVLKVFARAQTPGRHVCRAELNCRAVGTRLAREGSTFFYGQGQAPAASDSTTPPAGPAPIANKPGATQR